MSATRTLSSGLIVEAPATHAERMLDLRDEWMRQRPTTRAYRCTRVGGFAPIEVAFIERGATVAVTRGQTEGDAIAQSMQVLWCDDAVPSLELAPSGPWVLDSDNGK